MLKAVALDLDGDLLSSQKEIPPETQTCIRNLDDQGFIIIIATAHPVRNTRVVLPPWFEDFYWANCNGAWVSRRGKILTRTEIAYSDASNVVRHLQSHSLRVRVEANDTYYVDGKTGFPPLKDYQNHDACKILVFVDSEAEVELVRASLTDQLSMIITDGGELIQIARKDCGKLNAVRSILEAESLDLVNLIAFGDDNNDTDHLKAAGCGVAMANGTSEVHGAADYIAESNDNDGVGLVLKAVLAGVPISDVTSPARR